MTVARLQRALGYVFRDQALLQTALQAIQLGEDIAGKQGSVHGHFSNVR